MPEMVLPSATETLFPCSGTFAGHVAVETTFLAAFVVLFGVGQASQALFLVLAIRVLLELLGLNAGVQARSAIIDGCLQRELLAHYLVAPFPVRCLEADCV